MKEKTLLKIALTISLIGILILLILAETLEPKKRNISEISEKDIDQSILVYGYLTKTKETEHISIFKLEENNASIMVIAFKEKEINISKNEIVKIIGTVKKYQDILEISAEEITKI